MIHSLCYSNGRLKEAKKEELRQILSKKQSLCWIDLSNDSSGDLDFLERECLISGLALQILTDFNQRAKAESFEEFAILILHAVGFSSHTKERIIFKQLNICLGKNFVITVHNEPIQALELIRDSIRKNPLIFEKGADFLVYKIMDTIVDEYFPILDGVDNSIEVLEKEIFDRMHERRTINHIFKTKRITLQLKKEIFPLRESLSLLSGAGFPFVKKSTAIQFREVYDHVFRVLDLVETYRDLTTSLLDAHLSVVSNRLNEVMKVLTIGAIILMSATFVTGIYGMNFSNLPALHEEWGFPASVLVMILISIVMAYYFRKKKWF